MDDIKKQIIDTVSDMLAEGMNADGITVREITARLKTSVSAINYHFGNKENLMRLVVKHHIDGVIAKVPGLLLKMEGLDAREKLRRVVKLTADYLARFPSVSRISILSDLEGDMGETTPLAPSRPTSR